MKRKDLEDIYNDFSLISLSSPSRKSRRLDGDLIPIMQEDPRTIVLQGLEHELSQEQHFTSASIVQTNASAIDAMPPAKEMPLVLYNPADTPFLMSPSLPDFPIIVNSELIPGLKDHIDWPGNSKTVKVSAVDAPATGLTEPMEADVTDAMLMDMEDTSIGGSASNGRKVFEFGGMVEGGQELRNWQQQQHQYHMMLRALQKNQNTSPVTW